ncbi:MAG: amidohydrolase [Dehalococcoidia bacterium]
MPTILLRNAAILTMDPLHPRAQAVLVQGDRIVWVGQESDVPALPTDRVIDCGGASLLPGLNDAHIHLLAYAASLRYLDCSRDAVVSIPDIQRVIQAHARTVAPGHWIRARGYDESYLGERRHPTRADLDIAASHQPVRLDHRSGHACVLNSRGLELVGIGPDTPDPPEGIIERDDDGVPTGLLLEMNRYVSGRAGEMRDPQQIEEPLVEASRNLLRWGVTSLQDASPENNVERWQLLCHMRKKGVVSQRLSVMPGIHHLHEFIENGLLASTGDHSLRLGQAKVVVTMTTGGLHPSEEELRELVRGAHRQGFGVAVHAVEEEAIVAVLRVLANEAQASNPGSGILDRIEHCSEATPQVQALLEGSGVTVVTQPGFIYESAERYVAEVAREKQPWLYPLRTIRALGVAMAAGSDAPVASPDPWRGIYGAVARRDASGVALHQEQSLSVEAALHMYTAGAAAASQEDGVKGIIQKGKLADLMLVDRDLNQTKEVDLLKTRVVLTMVGGEVLWEW